eukprot:gb/GEZN01013002.1/.p1 GENE.gb/GEZN01013002.1/~~gb/GEZN01013002.1/.p1  ORF type:complete len:331 (-),score=9.66 gb/GEZN01013002.1/:51-953(-)
MPSGSSLTTVPPTEAHFSLLSFGAGSVAGGVGTLVGYPLDTLKVRIQTGQCTKWRGIRHLFAGVTVPTLTSGTIQAVNFGLFDNFRRYGQASLGLCPDEPAPMWVIVASGTLSGVFVSFLTCPQHRLKILQQSRGGTWWSQASHVGLRGLYTGWPLQAFMETGRGVYMGAYFLGLRLLEPYAVKEQGGTHSHRTNVSGVPVGLPIWCRAVAGGMAGMLGWVVIYPFDAVKSVMQSQRADGGMRYKNSLECAMHLVKTEGPMRLYRGLGLTLIRAGPLAGIILPVFDLSLSALCRTFPNYK